MPAHVDKVGTLADKNKFDYTQHRFREGEIDANGNLVLSDEEKARRHAAHKCDTVTMTRADGSTVEINAHEKDSQDQWRKLGYQTQSEIDAPKLAAESRLKQSAELMDTLRMLKDAANADVTPVKEPKAKAVKEPKAVETEG